MEVQVQDIDPETKVSGIRTQYPSELIGVPGDPVRLSWQVTSRTPGSRQLAYEIQSADSLEFSRIAATTGAIQSSRAVGVPAPGSPLLSRQRVYYRVRIATPLGWTDWSPTESVETGLLYGSDWSALAVGSDSTVGGPSPVLRTEFAATDSPKRARLYVTSLGINEVEINGEKVGSDLLSPGWTAFDERLLVSAHDVTHLIVEGQNAIGATLSDGWYRGRLGWQNEDSFYGTELALLAQLEIEYEDGTVSTLVTNADWTTSSGAVRSSGIYDGTHHDFTREQAGWSTPGFDASSWLPVREVALDRSILDQPITSGVREIATLPMVPIGSVLDAGQNLAGWVRLVVNGRKGDVVTVRHAEILEPDGSLHTRSLRTARATDVYTLDRDGEVTLEPSFTFHGFRYADVTGTEVVSATAVAISSAITPRARFTSSDATLNRLHSNVQWSQLGNFVSVPTDCPQRDERLGWTGDAQAFAPTASTLFHCESFWESWLRDLELDQDETGSVAAVIPNMLVGMSFTEDADSSIMGRAGWADAATIVPWSVYESFGSTRVIERQLSSMRRWVDHLDDRRAGAPLLPTEFQFGDWLDPDAPGSMPWQAKVSSDFVANAFFARSAWILSRVESLVGDPVREQHYAALAESVAEVTWAAFAEDAITTQTGCAIALEFGIAPQSDRPRIVDALAKNVREEKGRISTGFLGTPLVLHALSNAGRLDEAYLMLLCRDIPSWLYQVDMGATTVWERWDALQADGTIHPGDMDTGGGMLSFNHYAYGAVIDWVYRTLGGLAPTVDSPGYERTIVAPRPVKGVSWAATSVDTSFGTVSIDWTLRDGVFRAAVVVPFGVTAAVFLPTTSESIVTIDGSPSGGSFELTHGDYLLEVGCPLVASGK